MLRCDFGVKSTNSFLLNKKNDHFYNKQPPISFRRLFCNACQLELIVENLGNDVNLTNNI